MVTQIGRIWRKVLAADISHHAAAVAYHTFLAMVPLALALLGFAAVIGRDQSAVAQIGRALDPVAPATVTEFVTDLLVDANRRLGGGDWWLIMISVVLALLLGSRAIVALQRALATLDDRITVRTPVRLRAVGVMLTIVGGASLLLTGTLLVAGRWFFEFLAGWLGAPGLVDLWAWLRLPVSAAGLFGFLITCYHLAPPEPLPRPVLASTVATAGVLLGSLGFGAYLGVAPDLGATFGTLGAVAIALVWLYLGAAAILVGAIVALQPRS